MQLAQVYYGNDLGLKESVGKIKVEKLMKLPVNEERNLKKMFETVYTTLYT